MKNILIVENDEVLANFYSELLSSSHLVTICFSGNQAKKILEEKEFDTILSDFKMDDGDGIELSRYLQEKRLSTPLVLLTGFATKELAISAVQYGIYAFLEKRCSPTEIIDTVEKALEFHKNKKREENFSAMGEISYILMHELIDPINRSLSRLELLQHNQIKDKEIHVNSLREDLEYLSRLVTNVRNQVKGNKEVFLKKYSLKQILEVIEALQPDIALIISSEINDDHYIKTDVVLFNQVLENLKKNSFEAMENGDDPGIRLSVKIKNNFVEFYFINNSPEISIELRDKIFEPFVSTKKDNGENYGIGLYFCKKTLKNHGGDIVVLGTAPTTFCLTIPLIK